MYKYDLPKEPMYRKIMVRASELSGGRKYDFCGFERFGEFPHQFSETRHCMRLEGEGGAIVGNFDWKDASKARKVFPEAIFRIRGMLDSFRNVVGYEFKNYDKELFLKVKLNGKVIFNGKIKFGLGRLWRFWPVIELEFSPDLLKSGNNIFEIVNSTSRRPIKKTVFNVSDVSVLIRVNDSFEIISSPTVVHIGKRFLIEVFSKNNINKVDIRVPSSIKFLGNAKIKTGRNRLYFTAIKEDSDAKIEIQSNGIKTTTIISRIIFAPKGSEVLLGHLINLKSAYVEGENYSHWIRLFKETEQGNLIGFYGHFSERVLSSIDEIKSSNLSVAIRGSFRDLSGFRNKNYEKAKKVWGNFIKHLGRHFIDFGPHEHHAFMINIIKGLKNKRDISNYSRELMNRYSGVIKDLRRIDKRALIWDTDPSFYSRYYLMAGLDIPASELCVDNFSAATAAASTRGAARAFKKDRWAGINAFECQALGGLEMRYQEYRVEVSQR